MQVVFSCLRGCGKVDGKSSGVARPIFGTGAGDFKWPLDMLRWRMTTPREREAACVCGQLRIRLVGDPQLVSSCHCFACQRRTGAVFGSTSFFARSQIVSIEGKDRTFRRAGDSGRFLTFHFCPTCGSNVFWESESDSEMISVAVGAFADPAFPMPARTVWAENKHDWLPFPETIPWHRKNPA